MSVASEWVTFLIVPSLSVLFCQLFFPQNLQKTQASINVVHFQKFTFVYFNVLGGPILQHQSNKFKENKVKKVRGLLSLDQSRPLRRTRENGWVGGGDGGDRLPRHDSFTRVYLGQPPFPSISMEARWSSGLTIRLFSVVIAFFASTLFLGFCLSLSLSLGLHLLLLFLHSYAINPPTVIPLWVPLFLFLSVSGMAKNWVIFLAMIASPLNFDLLQCFLPAFFTSYHTVYSWFTFWHYIELARSYVWVGCPEGILST